MSRSTRVTPRLPRGFGDRGPTDLAETNAMIEKIKSVYERYGFEAVETPFFEYTEALGKFLPDTDRPNEGVFSLQDDDEQWLSLRYDLTAPLARYVAENYDALPKPYRSYRAGYVFRNEKPGPGRFRQFMQFDADTVGSASIMADAEMCMMAADCMEAVGIKRGDYVIKVNNRKVLDGVMEAVNIEPAKRLTVFRAIDKFDRLGFEGVRLLLGHGRKDESGDFTPGANLTEEQMANVMVLFEVASFSEQALEMQRVPSAKHGAVNEDLKSYENRRVRGILGGITNRAQKSPLGLNGVAELTLLWDAFVRAGFDDGRIRIDPSVVRGLEYYTGPVFEAELTFTVPDEKGQPIRFGSVGGGGRYDGLVSRFRDEPVPATGFSVGVSRLQSALKALNKGSTTKRRGPVVVLVMDREPEALARYQGFVSTLRNANIPAELYLGAAGMNAQLKYADKRNSLVAIIQGSNERAADEVVIKDLVAGAELSGASKSLEREAYLALKEKAQFAVPETSLVEAVRMVMERYEG